MARRKDRTEVSCCIKYFMFGFNILFWIIGAGILGAGIYSWVEKGTFGKLSEVSDSILFDPALMFIIIGSIIFVIGFFGCIGALRENTLLLLLYIIFLGIILLAIFGVAVFAFIEQEKTKDFVRTTLLNMVVKYRDDADLKDIIDWAQADWNWKQQYLDLVETAQCEGMVEVEAARYEQTLPTSSPSIRPVKTAGTQRLECCGVDSIDDWDKNQYFNCSSPGVEACGVPGSCCRPVEGEELMNLMCGFEVRREDEVNAAAKIYDTGCLDQFTVWLNANLIPIAGAAVGVAMLLILGICFSQNLRSDIQAQKAKWGSSGQAQRT